MDNSVRTLYVLELENNNYYVGQTTQLDKRLKKHFKGKGSAWTQLNRPIKLIEKIEIKQLEYYEAEIIENKLTIDYMKKFNWQHVRGGFFSDCDPDVIRTKLLKFKKDIPNQIIASLDGYYPMNLEDKFLYCILLEEDRYYLGISKNPEKKYRQYCNPKKPAVYIKAYKAKQLLFYEKIQYINKEQLRQILMQATINLMKLVGCYKVRGGELIVMNDRKAYELFQKRISSQDFNYVFPEEWLDYEFNDFMRATGRIVTSSAEII